MARGVSNFSGISNNDLVLLRKSAKKHSKISVKAGGTRLDIEGTEASVIQAKELLFISIPATNAIYRNGKLVTDEAEVKVAIRELKAAGRTSPAKSKSSAPELPDELRKQLEAFAKQNNSRVIFDPSGKGSYKIQKLRPRKKS
ncbi:MAG: hypothetical protein GC165_00235 [Armatimonadetes bacterium]|nr:hypothetical protein [Armatimonadota bacterium]